MRALVFFVLLIAVLSCDFQPEGTVITQIDQPSLTGITINLDESDDPIELKVPTTFTFSVKTNGRAIIQTLITLDDSPDYITAPLSANTFTLDPANIETGSHILKVEAIMPSGSGSIADKSEAEVIYVMIQRTVIVDHEVPDDPSDPDAIKITSVENVDGSVVVTWTPYTSQNFQEYQLSRIDYDESGTYVSGSSQTITSASITSANDWEYIYGKSVYTITLKADNKYYTTPEFVYEAAEEPAVAAELTATGALTMKWNSVKKFTNNFFKYETFVYDSYTGQETLIDASYLAGDTVAQGFVSSPRFGETRYFKLKITSGKNSALIHTIRLQALTGAHFYKYDPKYPTRFDPETGHFYVVSSAKRLMKVDIEGVPVDSTDHTYDYVQFAPNESFAVGSINKENYKIDLETMDETSLPGLSGTFINGISDNMKFAVSTGVTFNNNQVRNLDGDILYGSGQQPNDIYISPDGEYYIQYQTMYEFDGTGYITQYDIPSNSRRTLTFSPDEPGIAYIGNYNSVMKFNIDTKETLLTNTDLKGPCNYDPVGHKLGCTLTNTFAIINPEDLSIEKSIPVYRIAPFNPWNSEDTIYYLWNETIICPGGQVKLSDLQ